jgi:guanylate kinase
MPMPRSPSSTSTTPQGRIFIISAPSGAGKTTLCRALRGQVPDLSYSVSYTTRRPRPDEQAGVDYWFISEAEFLEGSRTHRWAEWARVHGYYYATSAEWIDTQVTAGIDVLLDIDVQGTRQLLQRYPESITIFIMPPSMAVLRNRLELRGTDTPKSIARRLRNAEAEIAHKELYQHVIVNDDLSQALAALVAIVQAERPPTS